MTVLDQDRIESLLHTKVDDVRGIGARHSWQLYRVRLADGRNVFAKTADNAVGALTAEAAGLRWLAEPDAALPIASVLAADPTTVLLPWLDNEGPTPHAAERFGRELAMLHSHRVEHYGATWTGYIADLPMDNTTTTAEWSQWYTERRLLPYLRLATALEPQDLRSVDKAIDRIDTLAGPSEPPSRVHGDLWAGNIIWSNGRGILVDPAAHGGHRETDLAMLSLFGAPYLDRILASYQEVSPLADGWEQRIPLHQLYPLLVHVVLFGAGYRRQVADTAAMLLSA
ncbi:fructosamine kinase family protein [Nocardia sp. 004]|uniref:fructosamine kinase family protein n=1 Tax=Nocardia sp. 004 TaxID=3385978 RepID=UPI0039A38D26